MPKTKISEYSVTNSSNTDIEGINIDEGCAPSGINNAIRELMVHLKEFQTGASGDAFTFAGGVLISGTANTITGNVLMSGTVTSSNDITVNGVRVGEGGGSVASNTALGASALAANTTGSDNTAVGYRALVANTTGGDNTAIGNLSLDANTTGIQNTAVGDNALGSNTTGSYNTALGRAALSSNTTANNNTAIGFAALDANTTGTNNTAVGYQALDANTTGLGHVAVGYLALTACTTGVGNTALGYNAGGSLTTGSYNTFVGRSSSAAAGDEITTGSNNVLVGGYGGNSGGLDIRTSSNYIVLSDGSANIRAYHNGSAWFLNQAFYPMGLATGAGTNTAKYNTGTGQLTYDTSSARYKDNIRDSVYGLSHVMQMRSTMFEYKDDGRTDVGLIAEELDPIIPELVAKDKQGRPDAVSYDRMVSVLVKAIQELKAEIDQLKGQ